MAGSTWKGLTETGVVPPFTKCVAIRDFPGEQPYDLAFSINEVLTVIEPCSVQFWYLAENAQGKRGVIPINFVKVQSSLCLSDHLPTLISKNSPSGAPPLPPKPGPKPVPSPRKVRSSATMPRSTTSVAIERCSNTLPHSRPSNKPSIDIDSRPPAPLPAEASRRRIESSEHFRPSGKYRTQKEFVEKSGWFTGSLETVLCKKMLGSDLLALTNTTNGLLIFIHKNKLNLRYVGKSRNAYHEVVQLFNRLFEKPESKLNPIEIELKYNYPDVDDWHFRLHSVPNPEMLEIEFCEKILKHRTLAPEGLNMELKFSSKENFYKFAEYYAKLMREKKAHPRKPAHLLGTVLPSQR